MSNNNKTPFDQAEAWLFGQMDETEKADFLRQRAENTALDAAVKQQEAEHRAMKLMRQQYLREQMAAWKQEVAETDQTPAQAPAKVVSMWSVQRIIQVAVAASLLLIAGYFVLIKGKSIDAPAMAMSNYPKTAQTVRETSADISVMYQATNAIDQGQYQQALNLLPQVPDTDENYDVVPLLQGDCHFFMKNYDMALSIFQPLQQSGITERARQQAEYRTLMVWLAQNKQETPEFKALLTKILNTTGHFNHTATEEISKALE